MASGMHAARSRARASCSKSAAGRAAALGPACPGPGMAAEVICSPLPASRSLPLPRDGVIREVIDFACDVLAEQVVERQQVIQDVEVVVGVGDALGSSLPSRLQFA